MPRQVARRRSGNVRYHPFSRGLVRHGAYTAVRAAGRLISSYTRSRNGGQSRSSGNSRTRADTGALYGSTFTAKTTYRRRSAPRRVRRRATREFRKHVYLTSKLQSAQNSLNSNLFKLGVGANGQDFYSFDVLNTRALFELVRNQFPPGTNSAALRDYRLFLKGFKLKVTIANDFNTDGTAPAIIDMYHIEPRFDIDYDEFSRFDQGNGNTLSRYFKEGARPLQADGTGELQPNSQLDSVPDWGKIGFTPFMYQAFCRMFKVNKIKTIKLPIGETYISNFSVTNKYLNPSRFITKSQPGSVSQFVLSKMYLKGVSSSVMIRLRGTPGFQPSPGTTIARSLNLTLVWEEQSTNKVIQIKAGSVSQDISA